MAKQSGLGDALWYAGFDVSGDIGSVDNIHGGPAALDVTGINKSGFERIGGLREASLEYSAWWNPGIAADTAHSVHKGLPTGSRILTYGRGTALGSPAASIQALQTNYDGKRGNDGAFSLSVAAQSTEGTGLEWGNLLTPGKRTDTTATNGSALDYGADVGGTADPDTNFGLAAYLHVFAFTGTSCTVKVQQSSDNGVGDAWADVTGGGFAAASAVGAQRIQTATNLTVERYLRIATTGTFSSCTFAVAVVRYLVAPT